MAVLLALSCPSVQGKRAPSNRTLNLRDDRSLGVDARKHRRALRVVLRFVDGERGALRGQAQRRDHVLARELRHADGGLCRHWCLTYVRVAPEPALVLLRAS